MSDIFSIMATTPGTEDSSKLAFWDTPLIPVVELHDGRQMLKSEFFNRGGSEKFGHGRPIKYHYDRRECALPECNSAKLIVDPHGYSFCPICHTVYNDGKPPRAELNERNRTKSAKRFLEKIAAV